MVASPLTYAQIHTFGGGATDGSTPQHGTPLLLGGILYGMTYNGGPSGAGTVFKVNPDGTGFSLVHSFTGASVADGAAGFGSLVAAGTTLYGVTAQGGASSVGALFKVGTDGNGFALVHSFAGGAADGSTPKATPLLAGTTLYGTTSGGGPGGSGTVYKVGTDGNGFTLLHSFAGGATDGSLAFRSLILSGTTLYGMTLTGGASGGGTLFKVGTDGLGFALLHSFAGGATDGKVPRGELTLSGGVLYGSTFNGGTSDLGTVFKINADGSGFALLHSFTGGATDGKSPFTTPTLVGSTLYGTTTAGGTSDNGTVFQVGTDGLGFALVRSFAGGTTDGAAPDGALVPSGSTFFGLTTAAGGAANAGTVFKLTIACGANEHVVANVCVACAAGTARAAGDDPAGADTTCAAPIADAGAPDADASVPTPDASVPAADASAPAPDGGATAVPGGTSSSDGGGCSISRPTSRSRRVSSGGLAAFAALAIAFLRRRRRAARAS